MVKPNLPWVQGNQSVLNLYMVPTAPGRSRVLVDMYTRANGMPLLPYLAIKYLRNPWFHHLLMSNVILDGDTALLHWQVIRIQTQIQDERSL